MLLLSSCYPVVIQCFIIFYSGFILHSRQALDLNFKCVSKKVKIVKLGITLESQFMKEGGAL